MSEQMTFDQIDKEIDQVEQRLNKIFFYMNKREKAIDRLNNIIREKKQKEKEPSLTLILEIRDLEKAVDMKKTENDLDLAEQSDLLARKKKLWEMIKSLGTRPNAHPSHQRKLTFFLPV
jgi:hypothetical protein